MALRGLKPLEVTSALCIQSLFLLLSGLLGGPCIGLLLYGSLRSSMCLMLANDTCLVSIPWQRMVLAFDMPGALLVCTLGLRV